MSYTVRRPSPYPSFLHHHQAPLRHHPTVRNVVLPRAARAAEAQEVSTSQPSSNGAVGFDAQVTGRMARSYPLSAVVGQEDIKEVRADPCAEKNR